jgi:hypothetical protein
MALVLADRVRETTTTTGTGTVSLAGPVSGFQGFSAAIGNANTTYYTIVDASTGAWEVGLGTYTSSGSTLARTTILSSSNAGAAVNFAAGTKDVFVTQPAERALYLNGAGTGIDAGVASFTANGVVYASSTSALATGSALTFDGTSLVNRVSANATLQLAISATNATNADFNVRIANNLTDLQVSSATPLSFTLGASEKLRLTATSLYTASDVNVGIGTSSPQSRLEVRQDQSGAITRVIANNNFANAGAGSSFDYYFGTTRLGGLTHAFAASGAYLGFDVWSGSAATERMRLDSSGNLGIGTSSPFTRLESAAARATTLNSIASFNTMAASVTDTTAYAVGVGGGINFRAQLTASTYSTYASIWSFRESANTSDYKGSLIFGTSDNGDGYPEERMRLDSAGNLGIGTSSPDASFRLTVGGNSAGVGPGVLFTDSAGSPTNYALYTNGSKNFVLRNQAGGGVTGDIWTATPAGNVGIGASSPAYRLDVIQDGNSFTGQRIRNNDVGSSAYAGLIINANGNSWGMRMGSGAANSNRLELVLDALGTPSIKATLDSAGNLGLGVNPSAWASGWPAFQVGRAVMHTNTSDGRASFGNNYYVDGTNAIYIASANATQLMQVSGEYRFYTAPSGTAGNAITFTQAMTLAASGNLLIGTTTESGSGRLRVVDSVRIADSSSETNALLTTVSATAATIETRYSTPIILGTGATERARITSGGYFKASNTGTYNNSTGAFHELRSSTSDARTVIVSNTDSTLPYGILVDYSGAAPNGTANAFLECQDTGATRFVARSNGGLANYSANDVNLSDRREKTNFAPAKSYLDTICAIPVQTFNYIDQNMEEDDGLTLGVVAQDVQAVAPELVMESNWGTEDEPKQRLSIYQTDLQYALMKCIQEQQSIITALTARVAALEAA